MPCKIIVPNKWTKEFDKFVFTLDKPTRAKLTRQMDLLESHGPVLPMPYAKKIQNGIWELRIRGKIEVRIMYTVKERKVYILSFFIKKSQKIPYKEVTIAYNRLREI